MATNQNKFNTRKLALLALLTAITIVLQMLGGFIRFGTFQIALVLVPIVVGAALCGVWAGGWLGAVFGLVVLFNGDAAAFLQISAIGTIATVLIKGIAVGLASGGVYKLLERKNKYLAVLAAAAAAPIVNTGVFALACYIIFLPTIAEWAGGQEYATKFIFLTIIGLNFVVEFVVNVVLSGVILRIIKIWQDRKVI
ncbi:MAG: ECF transporter S component [Oscillospiraceae bacterium]|jgi:uncharacterized membrane protein|nr:ECF transporter S component [Oscillospiraceae bacterium]